MLVVAAVASVLAGCSRTGLEAGTPDADAGSFSAAAWVGSYDGYLSADILDCSVPGCAFGTTEPAGAMLVADDAGGLVLFESDPSDRTSDRVWPDGGRTSPCTYPIQLVNGEGVFVPGIVCEYGGLVLLHTTLLEGRLTLRGNRLIEWRTNLGVASSSWNPPVELYYAITFDGVR